jgi:hypothetical protein
MNQVGHQNWGYRFQQITSAVGSGASEVAASGNGSTIVEAAIDAVAGWRQSPGHWSSISGLPRLYGYDMVRSASGVWYATGIFAE